MSGRFITAEGGEGVGKSAFLKSIAAYLQKMGVESLLTREPGGTPTADRIRALFANPADQDAFFPETEAFLVNAARVQHVRRVIRPTLAGGKWILCDRFADSTRVYQGVLGQVDSGDLETLINLATKGVVPDVTFVLDCDVEIAMKRLQGRTQSQDEIRRFDEVGVKTHQKIRQAFLDLSAAHTERMVVIDAAQSLEEVVAQGLSHLEEKGFV